MLTSKHPSSVELPDESIEELLDEDMYSKELISVAKRLEGPTEVRELIRAQTQSRGVPDIVWIDGDLLTQAISKVDEYKSRNHRQVWPLPAPRSSNIPWRMNLSEKKIMADLQEHESLWRAVIVVLGRTTDIEIEEYPQQPGWRDRNFREELEDEKKRKEGLGAMKYDDGYRDAEGELKDRVRKRVDRYCDDRRKGKGTKVRLLQDLLDKPDIEENDINGNGTGDNTGTENDQGLPEKRKRVLEELRRRYQIIGG